LRYKNGIGVQVDLRRAFNLWAYLSSKKLCSCTISVRFGI